MWLTFALLACDDWGSRAHILEGTILEVHAPDELIVDHREIKDYMGPMTMPFPVRAPSEMEGLTRGDEIVARLMIDERGSWLDRIRVTGHTELPPLYVAPMPLRPGEVLPPVTVDVGGATIVVGQGQDRPTALGFLYTTCPIPEYCPALVTKLQALQALVGDDVRLVTVTLDPTTDTREALDAFAVTTGARPGVWQFGRVEDAALTGLASLAGLSVMRDGGTLLHGARLLVLDRDGRLVERYDDNRFPVDRIAEQLKTGGPAAPAGNSGTLTP